MEKKEIVGDAELDLCLYSEGEFRMSNLKLANCSLDSDAYIEVGLRGKSQNVEPQAPGLRRQTT